MADSHPALTLEELAALNDEINLLVRAGVPLAPGLRSWADENSPGSDAAEALATRLERGESVVDSVRHEGTRFPDLYPVVVEAGYRAGRLPAALEAVSDFARELVEVRRSLLIAMIYPIFALIAAYCLFLLFVVDLVHRIAEFGTTFHMSHGRGLTVLLWLSDNLELWAWIPPLLLFAAIGLWAATGRVGVLGFRGLTRPLLLLPGVRRVLHGFQHATFARLTGLLLEQNVPLDDAVVLAAGGAGPGLQTAAMELARADRAGDRTQAAAAKSGGMAPFLRWVLQRDQSRDQLIRSLGTTARMYDDRARATLRWMRFAFPILMTVFLTGTVVAFYTLTVFSPATDLLNQLALPVL